MSTPTYTADEFANARFATHPNGLLAMRDLDLTSHPWTVAERDRHCAHSDEDLAADGWTPVREADDSVTLHTVKVAQSNAEKKRQKLLDHIASLEAVIRRRNDQIENLGSQLRKEREKASAPLSLYPLREAWENAEQADECRKGDLLIRRHDSGVYYIIYPAEHSGGLIDARILSRAPRRESWQDLADVLERVWPSGINGANNEGVARLLHIEGLRKTDGDDDA